MANNPVVRIAFLDVGQGDTSIITIPDTGEAVIVDCIDANAVMDYLKNSNVQYLRGIIATHLHRDHFSGIAAVLSSASITANGAATFSFSSGSITRTFLALNDTKSGFSSATDAIIEITGYSGSLTGLAII